MGYRYGGSKDGITLRDSVGGRIRGLHMDNCDASRQPSAALVHQPHVTAPEGDREVEQLQLCTRQTHSPRGTIYWNIIPSSLPF